MIICPVVGGRKGYEEMLRSELRVPRRCTVGGVFQVGGLLGTSTRLVFSAHSEAEVEGEYAVGGVTGANGRQITNSYSLSSVEDGERVGGLVGENSTNVSTGRVENSYAAGPVSGHAHVGGLLGTGDPDWTAGSYWDMDKSKQSTSPGGGTGRTAQEMRGGKTPDTFVGSDEDVWDFGGGAYPVLKPIIRGGARFRTPESMRTFLPSGKPGLFGPSRHRRQRLVPEPAATLRTVFGAFVTAGDHAVRGSQVPTRRAAARR